MIETRSFTVPTQGHTDIIDITSEVAQGLKGSGVVVLFVSGSTAGLTTIEYESGLLGDLKETFEKIAPKEADYQHHKRWGCDNGSSHILAAMLGPSLTVPFNDGQLLLGTWQQIILVDFDTTVRSRDITVQVISE